MSQIPNPDVHGFRLYSASVLCDIDCSTLQSWCAHFCVWCAPGLYALPCTSLGGGKFDCRVHAFGACTSLMFSMLVYKTLWNVVCSVCY